MQREPFSIKDLAVDGNDVMKVLKIPPSRRIGEVLEQLFERVENEELKNKREDLLDALKKIAADH